MCSHQGGETLSSSAMASATTSPPTMKIRKAAGPSPTLKPAKSSPQARHLGAKVGEPGEQGPVAAARAEAAQGATAYGEAGVIGDRIHSPSAGSSFADDGPQ